MSGAASVFVDTSVLLLARGLPHPLREDCRAFLRACRDRGVVIHVSVEALQEFTFHRLRRKTREDVLIEARALREGVVMHPFDDAVVDEMLRLLQESRLRGRDAVHAATAGVAGFDSIVTADQDFDGTPGLRAVAPGAWL